MLGIGDAPAADLSQGLRAALTEYIHVSDLAQYEWVLRSAAYLISRHGRIDRLDSLTEHWLRLEAHLRRDFNVPGLRPDDLERLQRKSGMAAIFRAAAIPAPEVLVPNVPDDVRAFAREQGFPLVFKPDIGVGAAGVFAVANEEDLEAALERRPLEGMVVQPFVSGRVTTFDGITDAKGDIIFRTSFIYSGGVMEVVRDNQDMYYYTRRLIPDALASIGEQVVRAFDLRARFFHIELFEVTSGAYQVLEVNVRPPGGFSTDMMNYTRDADVYDLWARVMAGTAVESYSGACPYHCAHISRRRGKKYRVTHGELLHAMGPSLMAYHELFPPISGAMGDFIYIVRDADLDRLLRLIHLAQELGD